MANLDERQGRWVSLVPIEPRFQEPLWRLAASQETAWPWRGRPIAYDTFAETLYADILSQYVVIGKARGEFLGIVRAEKANVFHGFVYLSYYLHEDARQRGWPIESLAIFIDHLFKRFNLRKVYGESSEAAKDLGALANFVEIEGCLKDHFIIGSEPVDLTIFSVRREAWYNHLRPQLLDSIWRDFSTATHG